MSSADRADKVMDLWIEALGESFWSEMTEDELHKLEAFLWGTHQDALMEWTRRKMVQERESK